ncbi:MAG TPA: hypothetical protein VFB43_13095 [Terracidiphilus sp.]|jgi:hypothetical protein|nr:hypothetical protein [Terracidiphilus sp.]
MGTRQQKPKQRTPSKAASKPEIEARENEEGIESLRSAVDRELANKCHRIARAIGNKAVKGDLNSTKLMITVVDKKADKNTRRKRRGPSAVERLLLEPTPEEPVETDEEDAEHASGMGETHD